MSMHVVTANHPVQLDCGLSVSPGDTVVNVPAGESAVEDGHMQPVPDDELDGIDATHDVAAFLAQVTTDGTEAETDGHQAEHAGDEGPPLESGLRDMHATTPPHIDEVS